jgi:hemerythrin-like metal-binding protein/PAS domain S-box-containing protein
MLLFILSTSVIIYLVAIAYISINSRKIAFDDATKFADAKASEYAAKIKDQLDTDIAKVRTLVQAFHNYKRFELEERKEIHSEMYYNVLKHNAHFLGIWDSWELSHIDSTWTKPYGRYVLEVYREGNNLKTGESLKSLDGDAGTEYGRLKTEAREAIEEPYTYSYTGKKDDEVLMSSLITPIKEHGKFIGVIGIDITLESLQELVKEIKPFEGSYAFLLSNQGFFIGHPNSEFLGKNFNEAYPNYDSQFNILDKIKSGDFLSFETKNQENGEDIYMTFTPFTVGETITPWSLGIVNSKNVIMHKANLNFIISIIVGIVGILILTIIIWLIARSISRPLVKTTYILGEIAKGKISQDSKINIKTNDEIGEIADSVNKLIDGLSKTAVFANQIGEGNLDAEFDLLSENDVLGNSLLEMRTSLKNAEDEEKKRKIEDEKINWLTKGLAKFGDILRQNNENLEVLSFNIMSQLVDYLEVNQGALYVINDANQGEPVYDLTTAIAYDRHKYMKKSFKVGEDLVGRCAHEKLSILMTDVPDDYVEIVSGMGTANPSCILLSPLILNDEVYGIIEVASFNKLEKYKIEFIEKLGESIASTISSVKINQRTADLLEQAQKQREELASQEEEMRQNLEELQTTQEEAARREFETQGLIHALSSSTYTVEYDIGGKITDVNESFSNIIGLPRDQIIGMYHKDGIDFSEVSLQEYEQFWDDLRNGMAKRETTKLNYKGTEMWLQETYTPLLDSDDEVYKVLKIAFDITELKNSSDRLSKQKKEIKETKDELKNKIAELNSVKEVIIQKDKKLRDQIEQVSSEYDKQLEDKNNEITTLQDKLKELEKQPKKATKEVVKKEKVIRNLPDGNLINWTDELKIGLSEMDEQHENLVKLANQLYNVLRKSKSKKETKDTLKAFIDYSAYHFGNEERYFDEFGYEFAEEHKKEHNLFLKEMNKFQKEYLANKIKFLDEIMFFIADWIPNHFKVEDKKYFELFSEKGIS